MLLEEKRSKLVVGGYSISTGLGGGGGRSRETVDMIVPANKAGLIIGSHGDTLRRIEKQAQVKMQFDQQWQGGENERRVIITGFPEDIEEARRLIVEKITEDPRDYKNGGGGGNSRNNYESVQMMVPNNKIGLVIGRGGETVKDLQERSGARIFVNQDAKSNSSIGGSGGGESYSNEKPVMISGDPESIKLAQNLINEILNGGPAGSYSALTGGRPTLTIQIPEAAIGAVMGKRAEILKSIISTCGGIKIFIEHSNIPGTQNREVQFTGPAEHCNYAAYLVQERVNSFYSGTSSSSNNASDAFSGYSNVAANNEAYASYSESSNPPANTCDYSQYAAQYYAATQTEMDPAALAAYYAQYYSNPSNYDHSQPSQPSQPQSQNQNQ